MTPYASATCPTCGQIVRHVTYIATAEELVAELRKGPRQVYGSTRGNWCLTQSPGVRVSEIAVRTALARGMIRKTYTSCDDCFGVEETIDSEATIAARRATGDKTILKYVRG